MGGGEDQQKNNTGHFKVKLDGTIICCANTTFERKVFSLCIMVLLHCQYGKPNSQALCFSSTNRRYHSETQPLVLFIPLYKDASLMNLSVQMTSITLCFPDRHASPASFNCFQIISVNVQQKQSLQKLPKNSFHSSFIFIFEICQSAICSELPY